VHIRPLHAQTNVRSRQSPHVLPSSPRVGEEGGKGKVRKRQPYVAALVRNTLNTLAIAEGRRMPCLPTVLIRNDPVPIVWNALGEPHQPSRFLIILLGMIMYECVRQWRFHIPQTRASGPPSQATSWIHAVHNVRQRLSAHSFRAPVQSSSPSHSFFPRPKGKRRNLKQGRNLPPRLFPLSPRSSVNTAWQEKP